LARHSARRCDHGLIAATCCRLDQFTGSWPVLELGIAGEFEVDRQVRRDCPSSPPRHACPQCYDEWKVRTWVILRA
jgi:hypothetical protein